MKRVCIVLAIVCVSYTAQAKVDLVTLPKRDTVQLTIYNSADLTLVRESRALTVKKGANKLQFSWANTLIDPTSLEMLPLANADEIDIADLTFPPRVKNLGLWNINSDFAGKAPVEITYFTSGLTWRAFYMGTLTENEQKMRLQGYVRVTNNSGEDYANARTRLIVGKVHILDQIAQLAARQYPYDRPGLVFPVESRERGRALKEAKTELGYGMMGGMGGFGGGGYGGGMMAPKDVKKEGLSEYFLYTIEGTETIPNGWSKRLPSFDIDDVPVVNLYKYEEERFGPNVMRFLSFANDADHELGDTPIPGGTIKVYRDAGDAGHLSYTGQSAFKYIPIDEDAELNLGPVKDVVVEPVLMDLKTAGYSYDRRGDIDGWDEIRVYEVKMRNTRHIDVELEIKRNFNTPYWRLTREGDFGEFEKEDLDTVNFTVKLPPRSKKRFSYTLTTYQGTRRHPG